jgi:sulfur-oxidizing protein SoxZ
LAAAGIEDEAIMTAVSKPRIKMPEKAATGEIIEVKALIQHVMETGNRKDADGHTIARGIIHTFRVTFEGQPVFSADWGSGISANPYISFTFKVPGPGALEFTWIDDAGVTVTETAPVAVA